MTTTHLMSALVLSLIGWTFVPDLITTQLLTHAYKFNILKTPSSQNQKKHYGLVFSLVILAYLSYTLFQSSREMEPNFYQILGVPPSVDEQSLKLAFRSFAKRNHPDRRKDGEGLFIFVRDIYEALKDPSVRSAYDRFGPQALEWRKTCSTTRQFVYQGLVASSGYHIVALISLLFYSTVGQPSPVSFWRFLLFGSFLALELAYVLSPNDTFLLDKVFPNRVAYQHVRFLHQLFLFFSVALSRVVPKLAWVFPSDESSSDDVIGQEQRRALEAILGTLNMADRESSLMVHTLLTSISLPSSSSTLNSSSDKTEGYHQPTLARMQPLAPSATTGVLEELSPEMERLVIEANIKNQHPTTSPIGQAWHAALVQARNLAGMPLVDRLRRTIGGQSPSMPIPVTPQRADGRPQMRRPTSRTFWEEDDVFESGGERRSRPVSPFRFGSATSMGRTRPSTPTPSGIPAGGSTVTLIPGGAGASSSTTLPPVGSPIKYVDASPTRASSSTNVNGSGSRPASPVKSEMFRRRSSFAGSGSEL